MHASLSTSEVLKILPPQVAFLRHLFLARTETQDSIAVSGVTESEQKNLRQCLYLCTSEASTFLPCVDAALHPTLHLRVLDSFDIGGITKEE